MWTRLYQLAIKNPLSRTYVRRAPDPGISKRMGMFKREAIDIEEYEDLDDMESDFMDVHKSYKDFEQEKRDYSEKMGLWIVKNKYFKTKNLFNLLTYSEKEQIRFLHQQDSEEWSLDKLATSFPATKETIQKILKSKWQLKENANIERHDRKVAENWEKLKANQIEDVPKELRNHLMKFANRKFDSNAMPKVDESKKHLELPMGQFSQILTTCKNFNIQKSLPDPNKENEIVSQETKRQPRTESNSYLIGGVKNHKPITIELFKNHEGILSELKENNTDLTETRSSDPILSRIPKTASLNKAIANVNSEFSESEHQLVQFREHIKIPKKLRKKGATYKLDDCYYDDDGEFLYRVPGMVS